MEFLEALKAAKKEGLAKEEFLPIWESEWKVKKLKEEVQLLQSIQQQQLGQNHSDSALAETEDIKKQHLEIIEIVKSEIKGELKVQFQQMYNQMQERQAILMKEMEKKQAEMREEFRRHFDVLAKHISNCVDFQSTSLKRFMTQELELVQRDLEVKMDRLVSCGEAEAGDVDVGTAFPQQIEQELKQEREVQQQEVECVQQHQEQSRMQQEGPPKSESEPQQNVQRQELLQANGEHQEKEQHRQQSLEQKQEPSLQTTQQKAESSVPTSNATPEKKSPHLQAPTQETSQAAVEVQDAGNEQTTTQSQLVNSLTNQSIPATGFYAEAIARLAQADGQHSAGKASTWKTLASGRSSSLSEDSVIKIVNESSSSPVGFMYANGAVFIIDECLQFSESDKTFTTGIFQRVARVCRARVLVSFDSRDELQIHFLVSRDIRSEEVVWPVRVTSSGYIYNTESMKYTNIWRMQNQECRLPKHQEEIALKPEVCLRTVRGTYPDVTYQLLEMKKYTKYNRLQFKWSFDVR